MRQWRQIGLKFYKGGPNPMTVWRDYSPGSYAGYSGGKAPYDTLGMRPSVGEHSKLASHSIPAPPRLHK